MCLLYYPRVLNNWNIIHCIESRKQQKKSDTDRHVNIKQNFIKNIDLNIGKNISDNNYGSISTIDKNIEN